MIDNGLFRVRYNGITNKYYGEIQFTGMNRQMETHPEYSYNRIANRIYKEFMNEYKAQRRILMWKIIYIFIG